MGEVYRARDTKLGRDVAIKVLPAAFSADAERLRRFEQEAQAAGALNHPNILVIFHIGTHEGAPYIVSEFLEGETLRERMAGAALPQRKAIDYALQTAHGLAAAHAKGIVHRDLKPDNLFVTNDGRVKILDFGLAKLTATSDGTQSQTEVPTRKVNTDPGTVMGTMGYMSPEQLRGKTADHRSDIFSFGAILYEMLSGKRAFRGDSMAETMSAILREDPPDLSVTNKTVSPALERVVHHCLEKNPDERFHSARDLAFAIESLSGTATSSGQTMTAMTSLSSRSRISKKLPWIVAALFALALIAALPFVFLYFRRATEGVRAVRLTIPAPEKGVIPGLSVSPDGGRVVYGAPNPEGKIVLWLRPLDSLAAQPLPGADRPFFNTFWSPDGRFVALVSDGDNKLKKIDVTGGPPQTLAAAPNWRGGTWSRDGVIVFAPSAEGPLYRVSAAGGEVTPVSALDESRGETSHRYPYFLPDGRHFLYLARCVQTENNAIYVGSLDSKETKRLLSADSSMAYSPPGYLLYVRGGTLLAQGFDADKLELAGEPVQLAARVRYAASNALADFSVSENGVLVYYAGEEVEKAQLTWVDRGGKQIATVGQPGSYVVLRLSPDDKRVALPQRDPQTKTLDIWLMELARGTLSRFTFDPASDNFPVWSPDGTRIVFASSRGGHNDLYGKPSSGAGNDEELLKSGEQKAPLDWSQDGRFIAYQVLSAKTREDIWILPLDGNRQPFPFLQTPFTEQGAQFSPDGRWIAYTSNETGTREVYVQSFPAAGGKWQISSGGGTMPKWRRDGKELFYTNGGKLMSVEVKTGGSTFDAGTPTVLFENRAFALRGPAAAFDATADGQRFLVPIPVEETTSTPITVVLNWTAGLRK